MAFAHIGLIFLKTVAKPIVEMALEYYISGLVIHKNGYSKHQIDYICDHGTVSDGNSYTAKVKGHYSLEETIARLDASNTELAMQIKEFAKQLHDEDDFVLV